MSPRRFLTVYRRDLGFQLRRSLFWVWAILLIFLAWGLSSGRARIQSGDSAVGGTKAFITSEFAAAQQFVILTTLIYGFFVAVAAGMSVIQDEEYRVGAVLHATPLRPGEYIWGKFLAVLSAAGMVLALHVLAMILFNHGTPAGEAKEFRGPLDVFNYVRPALIFCLPTVVFFAGVSFYAGERARKPILVFMLPLVVLLACLFVLWDWAPSWLDPRVDRFLMLIDPAGFRWMDQTQLKVDRGVEYYNTARVPLDGLIVANRLIVLGIGLGAVALSRRHLAASLRGKASRAERAWQALPAEARPTVIETESIPAPLSALGMSSKRPGLLAGAWTVLKAELVELRSSPGLYLFVPILVIESLGPNIIAVGAFDTPLLTTPGTFAVRTFNPLTTMLCMLLLFYTVESVWRERHTRVAAISLATPVRTGSILLGKAMANSVVGLVVLVFQLVAGAAWIAYQGKVAFSFRPFGLVWGLLLVPTLFLWTAFVMATLSVTRNRYGTYAVALGVLIYTGYAQVVGDMNWVGNWPLWSALQWSDISVLELDRSALWLNRLTALGLALLFTALTARLYGRRDPDANGIVGRLRPSALLRSAWWLIPLAAIPATTAAVLWARVDRGFQGKGAEKLTKDYWRKNLSTYLDWPLPDITAVDLAVDLDPDTSRLKVEGSYDLVNHQEKPLRQIPLTGGLHWESPSWTFEGKDETPDVRSGLYVFTTKEPIPKGGTARIGFRFEGTFPKGVTKRGGGTNEFILPSGVVLTSFSTSFAPAVGFLEGVGIDDENRYESKEYPDNYFEGQTEAAFGPRRPFKTRVKLTGPDRFTYNSVGAKTSEVVADGRATVVWESDQPVNFYNIVAGNWEVARGDGTAVYHHKAHPYNVGAMVESLNAARKYYSEWFRPYPWKELKLSEFPALASYAQGFPTDITFSESIGFLTDDDPEASAAFTITAHESAHQWWGNMIMPGKGPGGNLLSEGTSHFSTALLLEQVRGSRARMEFSRRIEDTYGKTRSADSERPLVKIDGSRDGDQTVTYDKTGWVLWMLMRQMGRERMLAGIRDFFETYHDNPDHPVLQDFLAVLRPHAEVPEAFDAFTKQWFFEVVVPEFQVKSSTKTREGNAWVVKATVENVGKGTMPVEFAATAGERSVKGKPNETGPDYREARDSLILGPGESKEVTIRCDFEPKMFVVDPDVNVLMLRRKAAEASL